MGKSAHFTRLGAWFLTGALGAAGSLYLAGCGGSRSVPTTTAAKGDQAATPGSSGTSGSPGDAGSSLPTAAISPVPPSPSQDGAAGPPAQTADAGSKELGPEQILAQMIDLRAAALPEAKTPEQRSAVLRERNKQLVDMAHDVIGRTHKDKSKADLFNGAVRFLVESRFQLASGGSEQDARDLIDDAKALYERDPSSSAAAEAGFAVVRLAHTNARQFGRTEHRHIQEFAIQARLYATRFPNYDSRAMQLLSAAAQICDQNHLDAEAISCYAMIQEKYPKSPQAQQAAAVLRRLEAKGKRLLFGGETSDHGFLKAQQLRGKPCLIIFWSSDSDSFQEMLPQLKNALNQYEKSAITVVGVCLDENEGTLNTFTQKNNLHWTEIFYADPAKRQFDLPVVKYYGVQEIPSMWLVNAEGMVVDTHVTLSSLGGQLKLLVAAEPGASRQ